MDETFIEDLTTGESILTQTSFVGELIDMIFEICLVQSRPF